MFYGVLIILEKLFLSKLLQKTPAALQWIYTMLMVVFGWVLFDTADLSTAFTYMGTMFGSTGVFADRQAAYLLMNYGTVLVLCFFASTDSWKRLVEMAHSKYPKLVDYATPICKMAVLSFSIAYLVDSTYNPFLYFNF